MASTYEPIATTTLGSAANTITFSSIPSTYTDIVAIIVGTSDTTLSHRIQFNSDTGTNYSNTWINGNGGSANSGRTTSDGTGIRFASQVSGVSSTIPYFSKIDIFSYAGSTYKTVLGSTANDQNGTGDVFNMVGLWRSTAAITTIKFTLVSGNYNAGTVFTLYGITKA